MGILDTESIRRDIFKELNDSLVNPSNQAIDSNSSYKDKITTDPLTTEPLYKGSVVWPNQNNEYKSENNTEDKVEDKVEDKPEHKTEHNRPKKNWKEKWKSFKSKFKNPFEHNPFIYKQHVHKTKKPHHYIGDFFRGFLFKGGKKTKKFKKKNNTVKYKRSKPRKSKRKINLR